MVRLRLPLLMNKHQAFIWAARQGSPLVIGVGHGEYFVGSDQLALLHVTDRFVYLEEGDRARLTTQSFEIFVLMERCAKAGNTGLRV